MTEPFPHSFVCMDVCSQLQEQIDKTSKGIYTALQYLNTKHDYRPFEGQIKVIPTEKDAVQPDDPDKFNSMMQRMAADIVQDTVTFEQSVKSLPGLDKTEAQQLEQIRGLQQQLEAIEVERTVALKQRDQAHLDIERLITHTASMIRATK